MKPELLEKHRKNLLELDNRLVEEIGSLTSEIERSGKIVGEHDSYSGKSNEAEVAVERVEEEIQQEVREALKRIEANTFGICVDCEGRIIQARLAALPYTPVCIKCEKIRESA